jgi:NAD(P)-dependent dehydrogenase (short-subunit alcohol dehydrogenase family)
VTIEGEGAGTWSDSEEHGLEVHLTDIVVQVIVTGELRHRAAARAGYEWALQRRRQHEEELVRRRAEAARKAHEAHVAAEKARRAQLLCMAADLRAADDIRALVSRVPAGLAGQDGGVSAWSAWALDIASRLDPVSRLIIDAAGHAHLGEADWPAVEQGEGEPLSDQR